MPTPGLDDITPETIARELRGRIYQVREAMDRALDTGDSGGYRSARAALIELTHRAEAEGRGPSMSKTLDEAWAECERLIEEKFEGWYGPNIERGYAPHPWSASIVPPDPEDDLIEGGSVTPVAALEALAEAMRRTKA